ISLPTWWGGRRGQAAPGGDANSSHIRGPGGLDEGADLVMVLRSHRGLHPARHVDAIGPVPAHDRAHVTRFQSARDEDPARLDEVTRQVPRPRAPGTAALVARPRVEHQRVRPRARIGYVVASHLEHFHQRPARVEARRLRAMQLQQVEADVLRDLADLAGRLVDEDAYDRRSPIQPGDYRPRQLWLDAPRRRAEVETEEVRAGIDGVLRVAGAADAADLHLDHQAPRMSRMTAAGSFARIRISPARMASAPASRMRRESSRPLIPLSATSTRSRGISGRRRSVSARSTSNARRSRWLTPITCAPASTATRASPSSCTSTRVARPWSLATSMRSASECGVSAATISSTASAPCARASTTW